MARVRLRVGSVSGPNEIDGFLWLHIIYAALFIYGIVHGRISKLFKCELSDHCS